MNDDIINRRSSKYYRKIWEDKYNGDELHNWIRFCRKICKNQFVHNYLAKLQNNKCKWCDSGLYGFFVIHHMDYNHICSFYKDRRYKHTTPSGKKRLQLTTDCELYSKEKQESFNKCMSRICLVHQKCNMDISYHVIEDID